MSTDVLRYEGPEDRSRREIEELLQSDDPAKIVSALLSATFYEPDWRWVQNKCWRFLEHSNSDVRRAAAMFLGELAVFHGQLDLEVVLPALYKASQDPAIKPTVEDSLEDIRLCVKVQ